ncbi:glycerophosphodiester phosphodiesterase family protein [Brevibacillus sp. SYSU BS000544]|uniref:glycerophosphodiester phosphodiesterase family protein n=1 Tax=Brevibacillus sp. SYSU BS000544 TaxID=3416443 RepID=UPI003CE5BBBE
MRISKRGIFKRKRFWIFLVLLIGIYLNNTSLLAEKQYKKPLLLAHRGLAQTFTMEGITNDTCTAKQIYPPEHSYLENTISSMEAAFRLGADVVELDVQMTKDAKFAVFHDWTLECRTNGKGITRDYTLSELQALDIGYGYTADGGKTYPFRGKGVGLMPSLEQVLLHFPGKELLIHVKSNDPKEGELLAKYLSSLDANRLANITVYGGDRPIEALQMQMPNQPVMSKATMKKCLIPYLAAGWTGYVPTACEKTQLHIPEEIAPWLWGWPNRFIGRMNDVNTRVILVGGNGEFSTGFDSSEDIKRLPPDYSGGVWTNRIDRIAPLFP